MSDPPRSLAVLTGANHGRLRCLPIGRVVALIGGLALIAAFAMPWFGVQVAPGQTLLLSGQFLARFLAGTDDLRRFMPGAAGGPQEVQMLRVLVLLFPSAGAIAAIVALATSQLERRALSNIVLVLVGVVPIVALAGGLSQLPAGSAPDVGLWTIGGGGAAVVIGGALDGVLGRARVP